jgi:hypothetical protein
MTTRSKIRAIFIVCGIIAILFAILFINLRFYEWRERQEIKPWITYGRLMYAASRCDLYKAQYGVWPNSLEQLRAFRPEFNDWAKDAWGQNDSKMWGQNDESIWGRDFVLVPYDNSLGYGELVSYGRDGKPGGTGLDRDLIVRFPTEANAAWNKQEGVGLKEPRHNP